MNKKIIITLFAFFLVTISITLISEEVSAAQVCCEKTTSNDYCQYVDETECDSDFLSASTSCDQTSFCRPGCCYDQQGDGFCYSNYAKASCEIEYSGKFSGDATCESTSECDEGCCVLGTQAAFVTETRCKTETAKYPDLEMDFRSEITTEAECSNVARTAERGCCVTNENSCSYTTRSTCSAPQTDTTGFFNNQYCSQLGFCNCAPANPNLPNAGEGLSEDTGCLPNQDEVYWMDSCGNPEGIKENCDYSSGTLCGDSDKDDKFTCESLDCTDQKKLSINLDSDLSTITPSIKNNGVQNGESWCLYDKFNDNNPIGNGDSFDDVQTHAKDLVGSRYYRSLCINGQELTEPCGDFRKEFCISGEGSFDSDNGEQSYTESKCVENRWNSCTAECNTADANSMSKSEFQEAVANDKACCGDISKRDCSWAGKCVPKVAPGTKFWEDEGSDICEQGSLECAMVIRCPGWSKLLSPKKCKGVELSSIGPGMFSSKGWQILDTDGDGKPNAECLSKDFLEAGNNLCRSLGDCGANYNIDGRLSKDGFSNTPSFGDQYDGGLQDDMIQILKKGGLELPIINEEGVVERVPLTFESSAYYSSCNNAQSSCDSSKAQGGDAYQKCLQNRANCKGIPGTINNKEWKPDWNKGNVFFNYREPAKDSGKVKRILFGSTTAGSPQSIFEFVTNIAVIGGIGAEAISAAVTKDDLTKNVFSFVGLFDSLGKKGKDNRDAKKELKNAKNKQKKLTEMLGQLTAGGAGRVAIGEIKETGEKLTEVGDKITSLEEKVKISKKTPKQSLRQGANLMAWAKIIYKVVNVLMEEVQTVTVQTTCSVWTAPPVTTEDQCERCNPRYQDYIDNNGNPTDMRYFKTCSEYRCKSLGASCELLNKGTEEEQCVSLSQYDAASPILTPWKEGFEEEYQSSIEETTSGFKITKPLPIYSTVDLAIETDEPSQCKMSFDHSQKFEDMGNFFFGGTGYEYFHLQSVYFPSSIIENETTDNLQFTQGGGEYTINIRCQDGVGNQNEKDYSIQLTISDEPDITAPIIEDSSIGKRSYLTAGNNETDVSLFVNEPVECRYALSNQQYDSMSVDTQCTTGTTNSLGQFECKFQGEGFNNNGPSIKVPSSQAGTMSIIYFKCKDNALPTPNVNKQPFEIQLVGTDSLQIKSITPSGELFTSQLQENLTLEVITEKGAELNGKALCKYTTNVEYKGNPAAMVPFLNTNGSTHTQPLVLVGGNYNYYVGCYDKAGNIEYTETHFSLSADIKAPKIIRAYKDETTIPALFIIETDEIAQCEYSTEGSFSFGEGNPYITENNKHSTTYNSDTYITICKDGFGNVMDVTTINFI